MTLHNEMDSINYQIDRKKLQWDMRAAAKMAIRISEKKRDMKISDSIKNSATEGANYREIYIEQIYDKIIHGKTSSYSVF